MRVAELTVISVAWFLTSCSSSVTSGTWTPVDVVLLQNDCRFPVPDIDLFDPVALDRDGSTLTFVEQGRVCTVSGTTFTCPPEQTRNTEISSRLRIVETATLSGTCSDRHSCTFEQSLERACEGEDCTAAAVNDDIAYPCVSSLAIEYERE